MSKTLIETHISSLRAHIPSGITLVCVSKFHPVEDIRAAYEYGERHFGESRVQELLKKITVLPNDIHWHFIGHLQTNKVRDLLHAFYTQTPHSSLLIESVDSLRLLEKIQIEAAALGVTQDVLVEVHVAQEQTKTGFLPQEAIDLVANIENGISPRFPNVRIRGLMAMATNTDDVEEIRSCFLKAENIYRQIKDRLYAPHTSVLSMGMSDDYEIAISCGATAVRIGSAIFGERMANTTGQKRDIRTVFFDQDGVLFNSMPYHAQAWEMAMNEHGVPYTALDCYRNEGRTGSGVIQELYERLHGTEAPQELIDDIYQTKSNYFIQLTGGKLPETVAGVREVLSYLHDHGVQCCVVTGSGQRNLINSLNKTFDGVFSNIISAFDVTHGKPDPEPYLKAWERSGFAKENCMVVENAPLGVRAAKAAGIFTVAVNTGILPDSDLWEAGADIVLPSMHKLLIWLQQHLQR